MNTDFYQITMAYARWKQGIHERQASFQLFYRKPPFEGSGAFACGLGVVAEFLESFRFSKEDLEHLSGLHQFEDAFIDYLRELRFSGSMKAVVEGSWIHPKEPFVQITASIVECQILETPLLNIFNFQTLVATKAKRICEAARGDSVVEFGLRRAQGFDGALSASRAAYVGGVEATSNLEAAKIYGIPTCGTMSHAWVMSFPSEEAAFEAYASVYPESCVLAIDTYDTLRGLQNAIKLGKRLRGIRLDSGDLASLSMRARQELDQAGLQNVKIMASGDLDEYKIAELKSKNASINTWGVGTRLVTAFDEPALGGVYKLARIQDVDGEWRDCHKTSNDIFKSTLPGMLPSQNHFLEPIFQSGRLLYKLPSLEEIKKYVKSQRTQST